MLIMYSMNAGWVELEARMSTLWKIFYDPRILKGTSCVLDTEGVLPQARSMQGLMCNMESRTILC